MMLFVVITGALSFSLPYISGIPLMCGIFQTIRYCCHYTISQIALGLIFYCIREEADTSKGFGRLPNHYDIGRCNLPAQS